MFIFRGVANPRAEFVRGIFVLVLQCFFAFFVSPPYSRRSNVRLFVCSSVRLFVCSSVRLFGVNSPEIKTKKGKAAKEFIERRLKRANIVVETRKREKYGRYLALVYFHRTYTDFDEILEYGTLLNAELIETGMAERYDL